MDHLSNFKPVESIHCLSSIVINIIDKIYYQDFLKEFHLVYSPTMLNIKANRLSLYFDTDMNENIQRWCKENGTLEKVDYSNLKIDNNYIVNIPQKFLNYAEVYKQFRQYDIWHFIQINYKEIESEITDLYIPTQPISSYSGNYSIPLNNEITTKIFEFSPKINFGKINLDLEVVITNYKDDFFWDIFSRIISEINKNEASKIAINISSSSILASRKAYTELYLNQNKESEFIEIKKALENFENSFHYLRILLYKYSLTGEESEKKSIKKAVRYVKKNEKVWINNFKF
ncbi:hypothetical protein BN424_3619 [Carnobacterium maltaromaticum LMA28]|uniref:Uncharacterized protein n=1 Tax=Carnobacterium maltaromaticum LMA28 TaxID=1234679 RepID=K8E7U6_CARML|nr:hypothetical protein [Carnobacterium maltaromaticum]CCO13024.2 hypothetical protein BN424_3619 [Carnobacterium maltaromaticum LMA28]